MTKKMKSMVIAGVALAAVAIVGASVLGTDDFLKLFSGMSEIVQEAE
jgi:hypothetical protein